jgi:3D (Asp-Asp-Asp) domain-containing protein
MNKTRLITGVVLLVVSLAISISNCFYVSSGNNENKLTEEKIKALQSVNVDTITKSVQQTSKLATNVLNTNTEDANNSLDDDQTQSLVIETNESVKTTKKKSKSKKKSKKKKKKNYKKVGTFKITGYCSCSRCCGKTTGITASGTVATAGRTIAADTSQFSFGSKLVIDGHTYTVEDRGGAIRGNRIDIFFSSHEKALQWGVRYCDVYVKR